jgi:hypothetical protein
MKDSVTNPNEEEPGSVSYAMNEKVDAEETPSKLLKQAARIALGVVDGEPYETPATPNVGRSRNEAGYSVGQATSGLLTAPTIPATAAPTTGGRSVPEVGGENAFGQNAKPELAPDAVEYTPRPSTLPESIELAQTERDAWSYTNVYRGGQ